MTLLLFAGNLAQAKKYVKIHQLSPDEWRYLNNPSSVRGLRGSGVTVVKIGNWYTRQYQHEILQEIALQELTVIDEEFQHG